MSDTLTMQTILDAMKRVERITEETTGIGAFRPSGLDIHVSDLLPKKVTEYPVTHIWIAHPIIVWLSKWLPMSPWVWREGWHQETEDAAYVIGGRVYVTSRVAAALRARG